MSIHLLVVIYLSVSIHLSNSIAFIDLKEKVDSRHGLRLESYRKNWPSLIFGDVAIWDRISVAEVKEHISTISSLIFFMLNWSSSMSHLPSSSTGRRIYDKVSNICASIKYVYVVAFFRNHSGARDKHLPRQSYGILARNHVPESASVIHGSSGELVVGGTPSAAGNRTIV